MNAGIATSSVADPGFRRLGNQTQRWGSSQLYGKTFAENYMKMKEIGLDSRPQHPLGSVNDL